MNQSLQTQTELFDPPPPVNESHGCSGDDQDLVGKNVTGDLSEPWLTFELPKPAPLNDDELKDNLRKKFQISALLDEIRARS